MRSMGQLPVVSSQLPVNEITTVCRFPAWYDSDGAAFRPTATMSGLENVVLTPRSDEVACPFFMPIEKFEEGAWPHPARLPLGGGWRGMCAAPGHEGEQPSDHELREFCNLGYAHGCRRLPAERPWDSVRFGIIKPPAEEYDVAAGRVFVRYICDRDHRPAESGTLEFDPAQSRWTRTHPNDHIQRMAQCFLAEYLNRRKRQELTQAAG
jgi:hypothetical protein